MTYTNINTLVRTRDHICTSIQQKKALKDFALITDLKNFADAAALQLLYPTQKND